eukprot:TRINITY_DN11448_c0_g2_i1.p1 TRINITY_DN11448_c0_g2~~TRINITY_DN11448_c0_g2_i1.p1  ORF type:complete len:628 (+),score=133.13 TRINITY_DN11448_c0_g2_i1:997-2880(+)
MNNPHMIGRGRGRTLHQMPSNRSDSDGDKHETAVTWAGLVKHFLLSWYFRMLVFVFYREVDIIGLENVPQEGPVIFCGNHQNQFVDALMLYSTAPRRVSFIMAAKSMKKAVVGAFGSLLDAIPVRRPQDEARSCQGDIISIKSGIVKGRRTKFTTDIKIGELLHIKVDGREPLVIKVVEIKDDCEARYDSKEEYCFEGTSISFKAHPRIDQHEMFEAVFHKLAKGGCIGIFPEGGSHDQTALLPMKDGVARFALGSKEQGINPVIIPVGLTYYYGHRFRSRAHVEFGRGLVISEALLELYKENPHAATAKLMKNIEAHLRGVTINAPDWQTLKYIHHMRRLYQPGRIKLPISEILELTRIFATAFDELKDSNNEVFKRLCAQLDIYQDFLKEFLVTDAQVESLDTLGSKRMSYPLLFTRMMSTAKWFLVAIPGVCVSLPVGVCARIYSTLKADQDLKASSVKLRGNDVKASYKILTAIIVAPLLILFYGSVACTLYGASFALLVVLLFPLVAYVSICSAMNAMVEARSTFPLLLSLHSRKYHDRFHELWVFRKALAADVLTLVETHMRSRPYWTKDAETTYQRILLDTRLPAHTSSQSDPFTAAHTSKLKSQKTVRHRRVPSSDSDF